MWKVSLNIQWKALEDLNDKIMQLIWLNILIEQIFIRSKKLIVNIIYLKDKMKCLV